MRRPRGGLVPTCKWAHTRARHPTCDRGDVCGVLIPARAIKLQSSSTSRSETEKRVPLVWSPLPSVLVELVPSLAPAPPR